MKSDYTKLKKRHPKAKVRNIKRLIEAIRKSEHVSCARNMPEFDEMKIPESKRYSSSDFSVAGGSIPVAFDHSLWVESMYSRGGHFCGTAACVAGFAYILQARGGDLPGRRSRGISKSLAAFIGVNHKTAMRISRGPAFSSNDRVWPRHAVALLENFLETGKVDWRHAFGVESCIELEPKPFWERDWPRFWRRSPPREMMVERYSDEEERMVKADVRRVGDIASRRMARSGPFPK